MAVCRRGRSSSRRKPRGERLVKAGLERLGLHGSSKILVQGNEQRAKNVFDPRVQGTLRQIESSYQHKLTLRQSAQRVGLSASYLGHLLKRHTGRAFGAHLHEARTGAAHHLLTTTTRAVKEIASDVGYTSTVQLDRHFKSFYHVAPLTVRRRPVDWPTTSD